jgi:DNA topoisomerase III
MKLIIAEKPAVAKEIASVIGANQRHEGYFEGSGYVVSYAVGHLFQLADAPVYDPQYEAWAMEHLPILPSTFKLALLKQTKDQYRVLDGLMKRSDVNEIVCATDAGREGELIFRHVYNFADCRKPAKRLWISSLTEESILKGMQQLRPAAEFNNLYESAFARAKADWLFGINFTRLYSVKHRVKLPIGRVMTPTLHLIVRRDDEINHFKKESYYTLHLVNGASWFKGESDRFVTKEEAQRVGAQCVKRNAVVQDVKTEVKTINRPLLYHLTALQQEANKRYGFSAKKTLDLAQVLYEKHKLLSYPRTDSRYLSEDLRSDVANIFEHLSKCYDHTAIPVLKAEGLNLDSRMFNNANVTDHHAIIPTKDIFKLPQISLSSDERKVLDLVIERFLILLSVPHVYEHSTYIFAVNGHTFKAFSKKIVTDGFKRFLAEEQEEDPNVMTGLTFNQGDSYLVETMLVKERFTKPKEAYTDASLLSVMENIDCQIDDAELKEFVKARGLGTPATRAGIIEKLVSLGFVERKGKKLLATSLGVQLIQAVPAAVKDVEVTAVWEQMLLDIEKGLGSEQVFLQDVIQNIRDTVALEKLQTDAPMIRVEKKVLGTCPRCKKNVVEGPKGFYCEGVKDDPECKFSMWKEDRFFISRKKTLSASIAARLLLGERILLKDCAKKDGAGTYDAFVTLKDDGLQTSYELSFPTVDDLSLGACPKCKKRVFEGVKSFYCEGFKSDPKCTFSIWKNDHFFEKNAVTPTTTMIKKWLLGKTVNLNIQGKPLSVSVDFSGQYVKFKVQAASKV